MSKRKPAHKDRPSGRHLQRPTVQRARICVFENEKDVVIVSAVTEATIIARLEGDTPVILAPGSPVFWIAEQDMIQVVGEASWDVVIRRLEYSLLSVSFAEWCEDRLLAEVRRTFPTMELQVLPDSEGAGSDCTEPPPGR